MRSRGMRRVQRHMRRGAETEVPMALETYIGDGVLKRPNEKRWRHEPQQACGFWDELRVLA